MTQSVLLSVFILLLSSSSSFVAPIHARKSNPAKSPSVVATPAPGPSNSDCSTVIYDMMDCLSYLTPGSNDTMPGKACCDGIESVLKYNPKCICVGLQSSQSMGMALNNTRALAVPKTCKIPIAAPHCGASTPGASTPGVSPVSPSAGTPMTSPSSAESPTTSPSLAESPAMTAPSPSSSGTTNLSVSTLTRVAVIISSMSYISAFSN
ncbi:non-specific lipid-transfer protein-like protein At2g13820 isoform X2 [Eutrema salsugineum]|uniref:non-specific lipid-transfer protein-like protein At2g13820 isoform X2 n=1 Tax=Eutrema salsugineum TaxID=72664 RepID=UPI000CED1CD4|nr:non-specific lipid-transfer protein-like protein At2g13820 isoform X2 [Eutrema salsugineum]